MLQLSLSDYISLNFIFFVIKFGNVVSLSYHCNMNNDNNYNELHVWDRVALNVSSQKVMTFHLKQLEKLWKRTK